MSSLSRTVAFRYLFSREKRALLSAISLVAVLGVAIGVATLVVTLGVMDGAEKELFGKMLELYPHVKIEGEDGEPLTDPTAALALARAHPAVARAEPAFDRQALLTSGARDGAELVAGRLVSLSEAERERLAGILKERAAAELPPLARSEVLLGSALAEKLGVKEGGRVIAIAGLLSAGANRQSPSLGLRVAGVFESGHYAFDAAAALVSPETAAAAFGSDGPDFVEVRLHEPFKMNGAFGGFEAARVAEELAVGLPGLRVTSWVDEKGAFHQSILIQKLALFLILMLIVLVAGFNIVCTLVILVLEKLREIGILKAIGGSDGLVAGIFLRVGATIGVVGTGLGLAIGLGVCLLLKYVVRFDMPAKVYDFDRLPVLVRPGTVALIVVSAMFVCLLAAVFPSRQAARMKPVDSLRHE